MCMHTHVCGVCAHVLRGHGEKCGRTPSSTTGRLVGRCVERGDSHSSFRVLFNSLQCLTHYKSQAAALCNEKLNPTK